MMLWRRSRGSSRKCGGFPDPVLGGEDRTARGGWLGGGTALRSLLLRDAAGSAEVTVSGPRLVQGRRTDPVEPSERAADRVPKPPDLEAHLFHWCPGISPSTARKCIQEAHKCLRAAWTDKDPRDLWPQTFSRKKTRILTPPLILVTIEEKAADSRSCLQVGGGMHGPSKSAASVGRPFVHRRIFRSASERHRGDER